MAYENKCVICDEAITNPVCPACLEKQMMYWIGELIPSLVPELIDIGRSANAFEHENTLCVICSGNMNVCPHCYCSDIYTWLRENGYDDIAEMFLNHFNYELDYKFDMKAQPSKKKVGVT